MSDNKKSVASASESVSPAIGWLKQLLSLKNKYGFFNILQCIFLLLLLLAVINPEFVLDKVERIQKDRHSEAVSRRLRIDAEVQTLLMQILIKTGADRAWVVEFHNGTKNMSTDLPFVYGTMRPEVVRDGVAYVSDEYDDFDLAKFPFLSHLVHVGSFYGCVEAIKAYDERLYFKLRSNSVSDVALRVLYSGSKPLGIVGLSFFDHNDDILAARSILDIAGFAGLLSQKEE
jgi:hypothetical protein